MGSTIISAKKAIKMVLDDIKMFYDTVNSGVQKHSRVKRKKIKINKKK